MLFASSRCWTPAMPASNIGRRSCQRSTLAVWLNLILKCRFGFIRHFPCFIASYSYCNPHACYLTPVLFFRAFASSSAPLHRFPCFCIVFRAFASFSTPLHRFPCLYFVFRTFASFSALAPFFAPALVYPSHVVCIA